MAEHENEAIFFVLGMERERGNPALHIEEQILLARRIIRAEAVDFSRSVLSHHEAIRFRILRDENGLFENEPIEGASEPVFWRWIRRADQARGRPLHPLLHPVRLWR